MLAALVELKELLKKVTNGMYNYFCVLLLCIITLLSYHIQIRQEEGKEGEGEEDKVDTETISLLNSNNKHVLLYIY